MERLIFILLWIILLFSCSKAEKDLCNDKSMSLRQVIILSQNIVCFCIDEDNVENNKLLLKDKEGNTKAELLNLRSDPIPYFETFKESIRMIYDYPVSRDSLNVEAEKKLFAVETYSIGEVKIVPVVLRRWEGSQIVSSFEMDSVSLNKEVETIYIFHNTKTIEVSLKDIRFIRDKTYVESYDEGIYKYAEIFATNGKNVQEILIQKIF